MATIAVIFGSLTGLVSVVLALIMGASQVTALLVWLTGSLFGLVSFIIAAMLGRERPKSAGAVIADDLRALHQMRSVLRE